MTSAEFHFDTAAAELFLDSDKARFLVDQAVKKCAESARQLVPVTTGYSRDHIVSGGVTSEDAVATAFFGSTSPVWHIVEFGSVNNQPYRTLTQAAEQTLGNFEPE